MTINSGGGSGGLGSTSGLGSSSNNNIESSNNINNSTGVRSAKLDLQKSRNSFNHVSINNQHCNTNDAYNNKCVSIIHFNDCYNIEPSKSSSGAAGFLTAINQYRHLDPIILFSGDILSPSFMSTFTKGEQMIPVLNSIKVDCAVYGNHEFDYGVDNLIDFAKRTSFPWLLSNAVDKETSCQLGDGQIYHTIERKGVKFGLIGLIEEEWLSTLSTLEISDVIYQDFVSRGRELAKWLKSEQKVDYVIALTHFRTPNDVKLSDAVPEIDLILGGHDHEYEITKRSNSYIIKSGTDFREFSLISLKFVQTADDNMIENEPSPHHANAFNGTAELSLSSHGATDGVDDSNSGTVVITDSSKQVLLCSNKALNHLQSRVRPKFAFSDLNIEHVMCLGYKEDPELKKKLEKFATGIDEKMCLVLGQFNCDLDGRFSSIRKGETNLGNFVTDIMLASTHADLAILNSGTLRSDRIHPKGDFTMRDLFNILGYIDPIAVLKATGWHVWQALENGVSAWPKLEGRFPQVSGCSFVFDPSKPAMERIDPANIMIGEEPLDLQKEYKLTTKAYLASGKDGYDMLKECEVVVPGDESPDLTTSILNHFESIKILKSNRRTHHRQSVICLSRSSLKKIMEVSGQTPEVITNATSLVTNNDEQQQPSVLNNNTSHNNNIQENNKSYSNNDISASQQQQAITNKPKATDRHQYQVQPERTTTSSKTSVASELLGEHTLTVSSSDSHSPQNLIKSNSVSLSPVAVDEMKLFGPLTDASGRKLKRLMSLTDLELEMCRLNPIIEGRIRIVSSN